MELPPYRLPTLKGLTIHAWERCWMYVRKAGTVILAISILLWALMTFPQLNESQMATFDAKKASIEAQYAKETVFEAQSEIEEVSAGAEELREKLAVVDSEIAKESLKNSFAGRVGSSIEPVTELAGFDWRTNIALIGGIAAKEVVVSTLGTAYSMGEVDVEDVTPLSEKLKKESNWTMANALSLLVFVMLYAPCFVTVIAIRKETGSWKWAAFTIFGYTIVAFIASVGVYTLAA
jgi:ferrous iron transport protein B